MVRAIDLVWSLPQLTPDQQALVKQYHKAPRKCLTISRQSIEILKIISTEIDGLLEIQGANQCRKVLTAKRNNDLWKVIAMKIHKKCGIVFTMESLKTNVDGIKKFFLEARALSELDQSQQAAIKQYKEIPRRFSKVSLCSINVLQMIAAEYPELNENEEELEEYEHALEIEKHHNLLKVLAVKIYKKHKTLYTPRALTTAMDGIRQRAATGALSKRDYSHLDQSLQKMIIDYDQIDYKQSCLPKKATGGYARYVLKAIATALKEFPLLWKLKRDFKQEELEEVEALWKGMAVKVREINGSCYTTCALKKGLLGLRPFIEQRFHWKQKKLDEWEDYPSFRHLIDAWKPNTVNAPEDSDNSGDVQPGDSESHDGDTEELSDQPSTSDQIRKRKTARHSNGEDAPAGSSSKRSKNSMEDSGSSSSQSLGNYPDDIDKYPPVSPSNGGAFPIAAQDDAPIKEELVDHMEGTSSSTTASHQKSPMFDQDEMKILDIIGYFPDIWKSNKMSEKAFEQARRMLSEETGRAFSARVVKSCFFEAVGHIRDCVFDAIVDLELNEEDTTEYLRKELSYYEVFSYYQETLKSYEEDLRKYYNLRIVKTEPKEDQPEEDHLLGQSNPSTTQRPAAFYLQRPRRACVRTSRTILNTTVHATDQSPTQQLPAVQGKPTVNISKIRTLTTANTENSKGFTEAVHMCILQEVKKRSNLWTLGISEEEAWQEVAMEVKEKHQQLLTTFDLRRIMLNWQFDLKTRIRNAIEETSENGGNFEEELQKWEHYSHIEFLMNTPAMKDEVTFRKKLEGLIAPENEEDAANSQ